MMDYSNRPKDGMGRVSDATPEEVTFTPPAGLELDGDSGEALVKWKRTMDGKIAIQSINGVSLTGGDEENAKEDSAPDEEMEGTDTEESGGY